MSLFNQINKRAREIAPWLDDDECLAGYMWGLKKEELPPANSSRSFIHGWRNGRCDCGAYPIEEDQREFVRKCIA